MEENTTTEVAPVPAKKGGAKKIIIIAAVAVLAGAGGASAFYYNAQAQKKAEAAAHASKASKEKQPKMGPLVEMRPLIANLVDPEGGRYLKLAIFIETDSEENKVAIESFIVPIRSEALVYLSGLTIKDTVGAQNKVAIADHLRKLFEYIVGKKVIRQVYFGEFVVQ
jgi:flagellar basal body-associated protein FliL